MIIDHRPDDKPCCDTCYKRDFRRGKCACCGNIRRMQALDERERPICPECYEREYKTRGACDWCGELEPLMYKGTTCRACYHKYVNVAACDECGNTLPIATRRRRSRAPLCTHHVHLA
jgi:hypothetical protein